MSLEQTIEAIVRRVIREELAAAKPTGGMITVDAYAAQWSISPSTVRAAIREGRLRAVKLGRSVRIESNAEIGSHEIPISKPAKIARLLGVAVLK